MNEILQTYEISIPRVRPDNALAISNAIRELGNACAAKSQHVNVAVLLDEEEVAPKKEEKNETDN